MLATQLSTLQSREDLYITVRLHFWAIFGQHPAPATCISALTIDALPRRPSTISLWVAWPRFYGCSGHNTRDIAQMRQQFLLKDLCVCHCSNSALDFGEAINRRTCVVGVWLRFDRASLYWALAAGLCPDRQLGGACRPLSEPQAPASLRLGVKIHISRGVVLRTAAVLCL